MSAGLLGMWGWVVVLYWLQGDNELVFITMEAPSGQIGATLVDILAYKQTQPEVKR